MTENVVLLLGGRRIGDEVDAQIKADPDNFRKHIPTEATHDLVGTG